MYNEKTLKIFTSPVNVGEIPGANAVGEARNPDNENVIKIWAKINNENVIEEIKFKTIGCVALIASGSALTTLSKDRSVEDAARISLADLLREVGGLPSNKIHAARLALKALRNALTTNLKSINQEDE
jgi:nitrogen fixation protein NifU and related proteins